MFPHTFEPSDVTVLLERIEPEYVDAQERQRLIASGAHFNTLLAKEAPPTVAEMALFFSQVDEFGDKLASLTKGLAATIAGLEAYPVLVSLVRAGTPAGVLVKRALARMGVQAPHYSVSIVQGQGLDQIAIQKILETGVEPHQLIFIDGWTGKGVVRRELSDALAHLSKTFGPFRDELFVLSDIAGVAEHAVTRDDVLIPSAMMSGPLCGLVSRTLYRGSRQHPQIHAASLLDYMQNSDVSRLFIDNIAARFEHCDDVTQAPLPATEAAAQMQQFLTQTIEDYGLESSSMVKPGIGESTRLFLRKKPHTLMVKDPSLPQVRHLVTMAIDKGVPVVQLDMPYLACTIM